jgi:hypothetical protein
LLHELDLRWLRSALDGEVAVQTVIRGGSVGRMAPLPRITGRQLTAEELRGVL